MAERSILKIGPKEWLTGLAQGAHVPSSGILYKANGITPLYDVGGTASPENGVLQAGASATDFTASVVVDTIFAGVSTSYSGTAYLYMLGSSGNFYQKGVGSAAVTNLRSSTPISTPANGITVWSPATGTPLLYYWRQSKIGTWDMSSTYPTGWNDSAYSITQGNNSAVVQPVHQFVGNVYYGNGDLLGAITDAGSGTASHNSNVLDFPTRELVTSISDDGTYLVIATTSNPSAQAIYGVNTIYFWDTFSSSWTRSYEIRDPFIYKVDKIGGTIYAYGQYGIYEGTIGTGFKKIMSRSIGLGTTSQLASGFATNRSVVYNGTSLMFATDTTVDTFGKAQPDVPNAYLKPFKVASGIPTFVSTSLDTGRVFVATNTPKLYAFDFNGSTHDAGNTAQTVYIQLPSKMSIKRIDLVFAEPLILGDAISVGVFKDEDTAVVDFGAATFAVDGAIRRKSRYKTIEVEDQMSILLTFTSGAVKLKYVEVFAEEETP